MILIYGRLLQVLAVASLLIIFIRIPVGWTPWLILPAVLYMVGYHFVKYHKVMLHMAARAGNAETVSKLLKAGFPINARRDNGFTALHWAVFCQHRETVQVLLDNGADLTIGDNIGKTPLSYAKESGNAEIVQLLVNAGAE